jgi:hypothetical protein
VVPLQRKPACPDAWSCNIKCSNAVHYAQSQSGMLHPLMHKEAEMLAACFSRTTSLSDEMSRLISCMCLWTLFSISQTALLCSRNIYSAEFAFPARTTGACVGTGTSGGRDTISPGNVHQCTLKDATRALDPAGVAVSSQTVEGHALIVFTSAIWTFVHRSAQKMCDYVRKK